MSLVVGITGLVWLRAFRNIMAPPLVIIVDGPEEYFTFPTMFRTVVIVICIQISLKKKWNWFHNLQDSKARHLIILDGLFSVTIVGSLVVLVWRGSFLYLDLLMFPDDIQWSAWGSTVTTIKTNLKIGNEWRKFLLDFGLFDFDVELRTAGAAGRFLFPRHRILARRRHGYVHRLRLRRLGQRLARIVEPLRHLFIPRCPHRTGCEYRRD